MRNSLLLVVFLAGASVFTDYGMAANAGSNGQSPDGQNPAGPYGLRGVPTSQIDTNGDGYVSREEMQAFHQKREQRERELRQARTGQAQSGAGQPGMGRGGENGRLGKGDSRGIPVSLIDTNGDGYLSRAEMEAFHQKMELRREHPPQEAPIQR